MPRKQQGWITFQSSEEERKILEEYCQQSQRTKTEILRELVRTLNQEPPSPQASHSQQTKEQTSDNPAVEHSSQQSELKAMKVSARNIFRGTVKRVVKGAVNTEVTLEIAPNVELISIITRASAEQLDLAEGKEAYAVIKSSNVMVARE
jgi:molybdopterin-binding protein